MKFFIPITDDYLDQIENSAEDKLIPFHVDYPCYRWLSDQPIDLVYWPQEDNGGQTNG